MTKAPLKRRGQAAIRLVQSSRNCAMLEEYPRITVLLYGDEFDELYFNLTGYVGSLPTPEGKRLSIGERPISAYRREVINLNKEFRANRSP